MAETGSKIENRKSKITVAHAHPQRRLDAPALRALLRHIVRAEGGEVKALSVVLAGRERVLNLNRRHLGHDAPTDVLAFPFTDEDGVVDGEIYVDLDTAAERCAEFGASFEEEARRYAAHGLLHLLGHGDKTDAGRREMRALEDRYLREATD